METFDFPYHTVETENPQSGFVGQFGNSYLFTSPPSAPPQRLFTLHFPTMLYFVDLSGTVDGTPRPQYNMKTLIDFYTAHGTYKSFHYQHPVHGLMEVKFYKPLKEPEPIINGGGAVKEFEVQFVEIP